MDEVTQAIAQLLARAAQQFGGYPLHVAFESSDGQELLAYVAEDASELSHGQVVGKKRWIKEPTPGSRTQYPLTIVVRGWDEAAGKPKPGELRAVVEEGGQAKGRKAGKRSTNDLIGVLQKVGSHHKAACLAVAFDSGNAVLIRSDDPDRQRHLDEVVGLGGVPLGLIVIDYEPTTNQTVYKAREFPWHTEEEARRILKELTVNLSRDLLATGDAGRKNG
jgi:hypothetical protein